MSQQYSLRWNNHQPNFISMFTSLLNTRTLVDVTLAAEGKHVQAHKVVLSACSTYFQTLFVDNPSSHPIVILKDVSFADLRTMVDFMYYGEVNVTEEQLPQVLDTAKLLKIKGLTEMPDSTSLTRSHGSQSTSADLPGDVVESQRHSASPCMSPSNRRKRRRKSSTGSTSLNVLNDETGQAMDLVREPITLSNIENSKHYEDRMDNAQQTGEPPNITEPLPLDSNVQQLSQGGQWSMMEHTYPRYPNSCVGDGLQPETMYNVNSVVNSHLNNINNYSEAMEVAGPSSGVSCNSENHLLQEQPASQSSSYVRQKNQRLKFRRQSRVEPEDREMRKQASEPVPAAALVPTLQKHDSYPQYSSAKNRRVRPHEHEVGSLLIRAVTVTTSASTAYDTVLTDSSSHTQRASHTPAVRSGPPLSCNFCWNTVDECGRILRRKTQYHCPECRTNLCIVPCFHEYHDSTETEATASAR